MRILFVWPAAEFSIWDVARGYRSALERQGHEIQDYFLNKHFAYHRGALPKEVKDNQTVLSKMASEGVLNQALYHQSDLVVIISGLNLHPVSLWLLEQVKLPIAVVFTESPYDDENQNRWLTERPVNRGDMLATTKAFTNDKFSAERFGWTYLPCAYDKTVHFPVEPQDDEKCDVVLVGTGWKERQGFLEAVNWSGIELRLYGVWPDLKERSPLFKFLRPLMVNNESVKKLYASAKVCLNFHRRHPEAVSINPRAYELAACGAFQLSDPRPGVFELFGDSVPTFDSPEKLEELVRYYIDPAHEQERLVKADQAKRCVVDETFDRRATDLINVMSGGLG